MRARPHKRPADKNTAVPLRAVHKPQVGSPRTVLFLFFIADGEVSAMAKNMSLGRYHELSSSSESWYALGSILPGGDCSHLLERRCGSESSQQCLDLSVLCRIRPLCAPKRTPWSRL